MINKQYDILAAAIVERFAGTSLGHCLRVDFLGLNESRELCRRLVELGADLKLAVRILSRVGSRSEAGTAQYAITADQAIALRNRKQTRVCLFVPPDMVDAAFSSLANSFEALDGRELHTHALRELVAALPTGAQQTWRAVKGRLARPLNVSIDRELDFVGALHSLHESGALDRVGLELWRVGLIADERVNFVDFLPKNRDCVMKLTRPSRIHATTAERVQSLGADGATATALSTFFRNRALHDAFSWSRALAAGEGPTFDRWVFPLEERSNIVAVTLSPFIGADGAVERFCKLRQPEGAGGSLRAPCGLKETMVVKWKTDPITPDNLSRWRIEMIPSGGESPEGLNFDLPVLDVAGSRRTTTIKLDLDVKETPDFGLVIQISALDNAGNVLANAAGEEACAVSDEFFLMEAQVVDDERPRESRRTVPSIAFGRLGAAVEERDDALNETQAQWLAQGAEYFTLKLNQRRLLTVGTVSILAQAQRLALAEPRSGGSFVAALGDLRPLQPEDISIRKSSELTSDAWTAFWRSRETYFTRLRKGAPRDLVEVADWTPELAGAALRYAQAYRELLEDLVTSRAPLAALLEALGVDSVLIRLNTSHGSVEEALVLLPTHPLRSAWFAGYTQLLRSWEAQVLQLQHRERKGALDLRTLQQLAPGNVPAFAFHTEASSPFVFTQNIRFFYAVALPPDAADPSRRLRDLAVVLNLTDIAADEQARQAERLADYFRIYRTTHPYADTLTATLVNADEALFTEAVRTLLQPQDGAGALDEPTNVNAPFAFGVASYVDSERQDDGQELDGIRQAQQEVMSGRKTDYLLPALQSTLRNLASLDEQQLPDAHVAVVADLSRPRVMTTPPSAEGEETGSLALHGLIARLVPGLAVTSGELQWLYRLVVTAGARADAHPSAPRYSDTLIDLHAAWQRAGSAALGGGPSDLLALGVTLSPDQQRLIDRLHQSSDWVITRDRFFALDYYDSPNEPYLSQAARKYLLDYAPEFSEGLGHRMMLTTASRDEIQSLLARAMDELGFTAVDQSVRQLLHYLKTVSGRLALQALGSSTGAAAVGLGVVTAWLQSRGRMSQAVLVPVDPHPYLFSPAERRQAAAGNRRCDLVLFTLKRNIVEASFIEVKWRRGLMSYDTLAEDMTLQMEASAEAMRERFFNEKRVDGQLHRTGLANVLRFYFERARRYRLFDDNAAPAFLENLARLERTRPDFRASYEGYIVSLEDTPRKPMAVGEARITILTAQDFESSTEFQVPPAEHKGGLDSTPPAEGGEAVPVNPVQPTSSGGGGAVSPVPPQAEENAPAASSAEPPAQEPGAGGAGERADNVSIPLGETPGGEPVAWQPSVKGSPHLFIIGIPGQGKSWTTLRILSKLGAQGVPALVLDFHGQFADPASPFVRDMKPAVLDAAAGLPLTPFECSTATGSDDWKANALAISEIFGYVAGLGPMQQDLVYTVIRDAYRRHGFDDPQARERSYPSMEEILRGIEEGERARSVANVLARLRPLLEMDVFRPPDNPPDLLSLIRKGLVVDVHNLYAESVQLAVGAFVLRKLYKDMFRWGVAEGLRLAVVLDEAHRLARDVTLPKLMKEGRKFGIAVMVASQGLGDFHQDVLGNAGSKVVFRVNYPESRRIAGFIRARQGQDLSQRIEQLSVGSAYVQTPEMPFGSVVRMFPPD